MTERVRLNMVLFTVVAFAVEISPYAIHDCSDYLADYHVRYEDWEQTGNIVIV